jgi:hypothetical protein
MKIRQWKTLKLKRRKGKRLRKIQQKSKKKPNSLSSRKRRISSLKLTSMMRLTGTIYS